jgi:hypothetical protein
MSPDGQTVAAGLSADPQGPQVALWNVSDGQLVRTLGSNDGQVLAVAFSPDGATLAAAGLGPTLSILRVADGAVLQTYTEEVRTGWNANVRSIAYSPDGSKIAWGRVDATVVVARNPFYTAQQPPTVPIDPVIAWQTPNPITYGTPLSGAQLSATADVAGTFVYTPPASTILNAGNQTLTASFTPADPTAYNPLTITRMITVNKAASTTSFPSAAPATLPYGGTFVPAASSTGDGTLVTGATGACSVANGVVTITAGSGTCTVTATVSEGTNYLASSAPPQTISATKAPQTLAFAPLPDRNYGDPPFQVSAVAGSGLPVAFAATGACAVTGATITITAGGMCTVTASQPGNLNYDAAPNVARSFAIANVTTTPSGTNVQVPLVDSNTGQPSPVFLSFQDITQAGQTTATTSTNGPPPQTGFRIGGNTWIDVQTTAQFDGAVLVCFNYAGFQVNENNLKLWHLAAEGKQLADGSTCSNRNGCWETVTNPSTATSPNPDTTRKLICGTVRSLSPFVLTEPVTINAPSAPAAVNTAVNVSVALPDGGSGYQTVWNWDDGSTPAQYAGGSASHTYTAAGVYTVGVKILRQLVEVGSADFNYVVVYDPSAGFVTGGGWINSPLRRGAGPHR